MKINKNISPSGFRYRGLKGDRFETLTDTIFGFSITLLVISSEVPKTYIQLQASMYSFIGFIFCALLLFSIWHDHKTYFLRYGLQNKRTNLLNFILLFVLLFYIYPMKYLFSYLGTAIYVNIKLYFGDSSKGIQLAVNELQKANLNLEQWSDIMLRFGFGLFLIYVIFLLLHINALLKKKELKLNHLETFITKTSIQEYAILLSITVLSIIFVLGLGSTSFIYWSLSYLMIPIVLPIHQTFRKNRYKAILKLQKEINEFKGN